MTSDLTLLMVGCGNMGRALLEGWLAQGIKPANIVVVDPAEGAKAYCAEQGVGYAQNADEIAGGFSPSVILFCVKPQMLEAVLPSYKAYAPNALSVSIAAGAKISFFEEALGDVAIIRTMPNTPATIAQGMTVLCANGQVSAAQTQIASKLFEAVGEVALIQDETLMDAVTAVSGSGPSYVFLLIEVLTKAGIKAGLSEELALQLAKTTVSGAGQYAAASDLSPTTLRENVTSPGGTTAAALSVFMDEDALEVLVEKAVLAAEKRGRELG